MKQKRNNMLRFTKALATSALLITAATAGFADTTLAFDDVEVVQSYAGSEVYTSDGKLFGTLSDVDIDGAEATMILQPEDKLISNNSPIFVTAQEGSVSFNDDRLVLKATEAELELSMNGGESADDRARILLTN